MIRFSSILLHAEMALWNLLSSLDVPEVPLVLGNEDRASATSSAAEDSSMPESLISVSSAAETSMMHLFSSTRLCTLEAHRIK